MMAERATISANDISRSTVWIWHFARELMEFGAEIDGDASDPALGFEHLSANPVNPALRPVYRSQNALRRFKSLHSPPIQDIPAVDTLWKSIILKSVKPDRVQFLPIRLIARREICDDFFALIAFDRVRAVDLEKSEVTSKVEKPGITYVFGMKTVVLKEGGLGNLHLARDEQTNHLLVSDDLKQALSATGQDSVFYRPEELVTLEKLLEGGFPTSGLQ